MNANKQDAGGLLPCPFCGDNNLGHKADCYLALCLLPDIPPPAVMEAAWNRRAELCRAAPSVCGECGGKGVVPMGDGYSLDPCGSCYAAPVADGAVPLWISCHWREDLARDSVVSVVNRQDPAHTLQVYVSTHPHDASAVTEAMVERAMNASMPGGSTAWVWLFNCEGGMRPEDKHLDWFRRVLTAALPSPPKEREE